MKWIKASERLPEVDYQKSLNIKYKGKPELLVCLNGRWCWAGNSFAESNDYPVQKESWAAIEWLDESQDPVEQEENIKELLERKYNEGFVESSRIAGKRIKELETALWELVSLKDIKDNFGKTDDYNDRQPKAWESARQLFITKK